MPKPVIFGNLPDLMARDGLTETVQVWEDGMRADTGRGSFEWWYFDAHFDDPATDPGARGTTAVIVFATKPLLERRGPLKPNLSLTITRPDGTKTARFPLFPPAQFSAAREACDVRIGKNWARGDLHRYEVHIEMDAVAGARGADSKGGPLAADLVFTGLVPPWRPGAGKAYFGDLEHYFAWLPAIPHGSVEGTLTFDGQTYKVNGAGYHDHNWGNVGLNEVMDHWYWGRAHLGEYTLIFVEQVTAAAYGYTRLPVFMLAKGDRILTGESEPLRMQAHDFVPHLAGRGYPREVDFTWASRSESVRLRLRQPKLIEGISLLSFLPKWQAALARLLANPFYFRFSAELELEIALGEVQANERGPALYEIMILQGKKHV